MIALYSLMIVVLAYYIKKILSDFDGRITHLENVIKYYEVDKNEVDD